MFSLCSIYVPIDDETAGIACLGEATRGPPRPERENPTEKKKKEREARGRPPGKPRLVEQQRGRATDPTNT